MAGGNWLSLFFRHLIGRDSLLGAFVPLGIYLGLRALAGGVPAAAATLAYSLVYSLVVYLLRRKIDFWGGLSLVLAGISLAALLVFRNEKLFLLKGIAMDALFFLIFAGSLFAKRPMMQVIVEGSTEIDESFSSLDCYPGIWRFETLVWAGYYLFWTLVELLLYRFLSPEVYLATQTLVNNLSFYALLGFSFYYPELVLRRRYAAAASQPQGEAEGGR